MKPLKFILAAMLLTGIIGGNRIGAAGTENARQPAKKQAADMEKLYDIITRPESQLTTPELILKLKFALFYNEGNYVENGDLKNKLTEKDFVKAGYPASLYAKTQEGLKKYNLERAQQYSVEERTRMQRKAEESYRKQKPEIEKRLADLEKQQAGKQ